jgi:serine/threonine protein kinase
MIHGDIKPENVLIYKDGTGMFTARLTDFGYSTILTNEHGYVCMPKSWPWFAPEHHHRGFTPDAARKMDMFSFGMLTLWVLYEQYLSGAISLPYEMQWANSYFSDGSANVDEWVLHRLKQKNELVPFAQQLVSSDTDLEESVKPGLEGFFISILQCKPEDREVETRNSA